MTDPIPSRRIERLSSLLVCPRCRVRLDGSLCSNCGLTAQRTPTQFRFIEAGPPADRDALLGVKETVKRRYPRLYPRLIELLSPVYTSRLLRGLLQDVPPDSSLVLDLGSGAGRH
ncbi:MAG TPA: hypothetical protein VGR02_04445, partial [Thermoanaerobaculia bacterium]|nr:hypothetical protein [Thermoanaerobaculia bacterium]